MLHGGQQKGSKSRHPNSAKKKDINPRADTRERRFAQIETTDPREDQRRGCGGRGKKKTGTKGVRPSGTFGKKEKRGKTGGELEKTAWVAGTKKSRSDGAQPFIKADQPERK